VPLVLKELGIHWEKSSGFNRALVEEIAPRVEEAINSVIGVGLEASTAPDAPKPVRVEIDHKDNLEIHMEKTSRVSEPDERQSIIYAIRSALDDLPGILSRVKARLLLQSGEATMEPPSPRSIKVLRENGEGKA